MNRFVSIFLSICLIISLSSVAFADAIDIVDEANYCLCDFEMLGYNNNWQSICSVNEYLPSLNQHGTPFTAIQCESINLNYLTLQSDANFNGYYSFYVYLSFYSDRSQTSNINYGDFIAWWMTKGIYPSNQSSNLSYPHCEIGVFDGQGSYSGFNYKFTVCLKWDIHCQDCQYIRHDLNNDSFWVGTNSETWMIVPTNISIVHYNSSAIESNPDYTSTLNTIAGRLLAIESDLDNYYPQVIEYLDDLSFYIQSIEDYQSIIEEDATWIKSFLQANLGPSGATSRAPLYQLIYAIKHQLADTDDNQTLIYKLLTNYITTANLLNFTYTSPSGVTTYQYNTGGTGFISGLTLFIRSINNYLAYEYTTKSLITQSPAYTAGDSVYDDINNSNGFSGLGNFASSASGFGNIGLIGSIFNGLASAFRWFSDATRLNIDAVPPTRSGDPISNYYQENQDRIFEFLETESGSS